MGTYEYLLVLTFYCMGDKQSFKLYLEYLTVVHSVHSCFFGLFLTLTEDVLTFKQTAEFLKKLTYFHFFISLFSSKIATQNFCGLLDETIKNKVFDCFCASITQSKKLCTYNPELKFRTKSESYTYNLELILRTKSENSYNPELIFRTKSESFVKP